MKKAIFTSITISSLFIMLSCSKDQTPDDITLSCEETISFEADIRTIIMSSCATSGCHNENTASSGYSFESYQNIEANKEIMLRTMRQEPGVTPMPVGQPLDSDLIDKFECWMEQGAKNN